MRRRRRTEQAQAAIAAVAAGLVLGSLAIGAGQTAVNRDAKVMADFMTRVREYSALQRKLAGTLPKVPDKATPEQIDARQRNLGKLVIEARRTAKKGDVFGPDIAALIRQRLAPVFKGAEGAKLRSAINEEPHPVVPAVNARYPDEVPLSTMPPDVLKVLPTLEDGLEFRFIGRHLILLDPAAHLIVDVVDNAMPG